MSEATRTISGVPADAHGMKFVDTCEIDQAHHRLYAGDNWAGGVDVFDISGPQAKYLKSVRGARGTYYGVCIAPELNRVFVGMSGGHVIVLDSDPGSSTFDTIIATIDVGGHGSADLIDYDSVHQKVYVANRNDGFVTSIDARTNAVAKKIDGLGGALEQPRFNAADGMVYLSGNAENVLYQIEAATDRVVGKLEIGEPCHPNGLAINPKTNKAVLANSGRNNKCVVLDLAAGKLDSIADTGGGDGATYDPVADRFFFAASGFRDGPVVGIFDGQAKFLGNVPTGRMASWVAYDQTNALLYFPTITEGRPALLSIPLPDL